MTNKEFKKARHELGLTLSQLAEILNVNDRTIRRWEADSSTKGSRAPNPVAVRVMEWLLNGFKPV